jgi:hypothetical protein
MSAAIQRYAALLPQVSLPSGHVMAARRFRPPHAPLRFPGAPPFQDVEKVTLVLEGIGMGKVLVNSASLDHLFVILAGGALEIVGIAKAGWAFGLLARP